MRLSFDGVNIELCWGLNYVAPDPNWSIPPHAHSVFEGHFVMEGKGTTFLECEELELIQDIFYLAPPHEIHAQSSDRSYPLSLYFLGFQITFEDKRIQLPRIYSLLPYLRQELEVIMQIKQQSSISSKIRFQMRLMELIWQIIEPELSYSIAGKQDNPLVSAQYYVDKALAYAENHLLEHPSIEEIAASCNITPRHLTRIFSKTMDISIHDYIQRERYVWTLAQLRNTSLTLHEISDALSFSSTQYFNHWFKKMANVTALEFRKQQNL